jgi:hypothetical protein
MNIFLDQYIAISISRIRDHCRDAVMLLLPIRLLPLISTGDEQ